MHVFRISLNKRTKRLQECSESVIRRQRLSAVHNQFNLGAPTPLLSLQAVSVLAFRLGQQMEVTVQLLSLVLVIVNT